MCSPCCSPSCIPDSIIQLSEFVLDIQLSEFVLIPDSIIQLSEFVLDIQLSEFVLAIQDLILVTGNVGFSTVVLNLPIFTAVGYSLGVPVGVPSGMSTVVGNPSKYPVCCRA